MPKKVIKKRKSPARKSATTHSRPDQSNKVLVDNFVALQKVMTNLAVKFDDMTNQLSKLLELFEISAKALAEKDTSLDRDKKQNKIIARGVSMIHENDSPEDEFDNEFNDEPERIKPMTKPTLRAQLPSQRPPAQQSQVQEQGKDQYYKSISNKR